MRVTRSTTCSFKFVSKEKRNLLRILIGEYSRIVNYLIDYFWQKELPTKRLTKIDVDSWLSAGLKRDAANEAVWMVRSAKSKPCYSGKKIMLRDMCRYAQLQFPNDTSHFDYWVHLRNLGDGIVMDLPIKSHKHFRRLQKRGKMNQACIISPDSVQFSFTIETGPKHEEGVEIGLDLGINHFLATSQGNILGDIKPIIDNMLRKNQGSKARKGMAIHLRQEMDRVIKQLPSEAKTIFVEKLTGISSGTRKRVAKRSRCLIGSWNQAYAMSRIKRFCEDNRVAYRSVNPYNTSITCSACGKTDKKNRVGNIFECSCGHNEHADINAAKNILQRGKLAAVHFAKDAMVDASPQSNKGEGPV